MCLHVVSLSPPPPSHLCMAPRASFTSRIFVILRAPHKIEAINAATRLPGYRLPATGYAAFLAARARLVQKALVLTKPQGKETKHAKYASHFTCSSGFSAAEGGPNPVLILPTPLHLDSIHCETTAKLHFANPPPYRVDEGAERGNPVLASLPTTSHVVF